MKATIQFLVAFIFISSCNMPMAYFKEGDYQKAFSSAAKKISKKPKKAFKYQSCFLESFAILNYNQCNKIATSLSISNNYDLMKKEVSEMQKRQNTLSKNCFYLNIDDPKKVIGWKNTDSINQLIDNTAFIHFKDKYENTYAFVESDKIMYAPLADKYLASMQTYKSNEHDYASMHLDLVSKGVLKTRVKFFNDTPDPIFNDMFSEFDTYKMSKKWYEYSLDSALQNLDRILTIEVKDVHPGQDNYSTSSTSYSKEIIDHYDNVIIETSVPQPDLVTYHYIKVDTVTVQREIRTPQPPIIKRECKQVPIYVTVHATQFESTLSRTANGTFYLNLYDVKKQELIFDKKLQANFSFSDTSCEISGDNRAMDFGASCSSKSLSSPSEITMLEALRKEIYKRVVGEVKKL